MAEESPPSGGFKLMVQTVKISRKFDSI